MTTDYDWLQGQLDRYSYRPRWQWLIEQAAADGFWGPGFQVRVTFWATDAHDQGQEVRIISVQPVPSFVVQERDPALFARWFQMTIFEVEKHESREWLRRDGHLVDDPHKQEKILPQIP
jgi:hypothetical protein